MSSTFPGEVHVVNSQIRSINNASGHYRPSGPSAQSAAENAFNALDLDVATAAYREIVEISPGELVDLHFDADGHWAR